MRAGAANATRARAHDAMRCAQACMVSGCVSYPLVVCSFDPPDFYSDQMVHSRNEKRFLNRLIAGLRLRAADWQSAD